MDERVMYMELMRIFRNNSSGMSVGKIVQKFPPKCRPTKHEILWLATRENNLKVVELYGQQCISVVPFVPVMECDSMK